jgi:hypothetical protein
MTIRATIIVASIVVDDSDLSYTNLTADVHHVNAAMTAFINTDSVNQWFYETIPLSELSVFLLEKNIADPLLIDDKYVNSFTKQASDFLTMSESFVRAVTYKRSFTDSFTLDDLSQIDKDFYGNKGNIFTFADLLGLTYNKITEDNITIGEVVKLAIDYQRSIEDSYGLDESYTSLFNKAVFDGFTLDDSALVNKDFYGNKGNILGLSEVFKRALIYKRAFSDNYSFSDLSDQHVNKYIYDSVRVFDDTILNGTLGTNVFNTSQLNSPPFIYEGGKATKLNIESFKGLDTLSFSEVDVRALAKVLADNVNFGSDVIGVGISKSISDGFTLDDGALIDKDFYGNKGNIIGLSETDAKDTTKSLTDSFPIDDTPNKSMAKTFTDTFTFGSDLLGLQISKSISDGFTLDDSALIDKDFYGNKGNIVNINDLVVITKTTIGRVLNGASLNKTTLN